LARAAAKGGRGKKQAARPAGRSQQVAAAKTAAQRRPDYETQLFFGRLRRNAKWVFAFLAVVFAGSFVFLGVGSGGSALTDFLNGNIHLFGSGGGPSVESVQKKVAKDPTDPKLRLQLAQLLAKDARYDESIAQYDRYLNMKPRNQTALQELANVYAGKVQALKSEVQSPPTPPLAALANVKAVPSETHLGTALDAIAPTAFNITSLQQGETALLQKDLDNEIKKHVGVYERLATLQPGDSSAFLAAADAANKDGDTALQISLYQKFLTKYPGDPLAPDIKRQIKALKKQLASGQISAQAQTQTQTIPGTPTPTG
jgi:tetratricopeptide (TPR) repeat protein